MDWNATKLGFNYHPGTLGLVDAEVVAAGSNAEFVVVERQSKESGRTEFYIVAKESSSSTHSGAVEGPFTDIEFRQLTATRKLPGFRWRKKR